jgi:putative peptidoglycan lipid II flippase
MLLSRPLVELLLERGSFDAASTELTASALSIYAFSILAMALNAMLTAAFHARQDTATPMRVGLARVAANVLLCALLVAPLAHRGIALANTAAEFLKLGLLFLLLRRFFSPAEMSRTLGSLARLLPAAAVMAAAVHAGAGLLGVLPGGKPVQLAAAVVLGALVYAGGLAVFWHRDLSYFLRVARAAIRPPRTAAGVAG